MKQGVARGIVNQITLAIESEQCARHAVNESIIPEKKTISEYESALDKATRKFFLDGRDEEMINVLNDAKQHDLMPKDYKSFDVKNFYRHGMFIRKAYITYENKKNIVFKIFFIYGSIKVTNNTVNISGDIELTEGIFKLIKDCKNSAVKIKKILK